MAIVWQARGSAASKGDAGPTYTLNTTNTFAPGDLSVTLVAIYDEPDLTALDLTDSKGNTYTKFLDIEYDTHLRLLGWYSIIAFGMQLSDDQTLTATGTFPR